MRIRVRVTAPVEMLHYVRRTNGLRIRTGAEPKIAEKKEQGQTRGVRMAHRDGVVHRLRGGGIAADPAQPVNNAGEAIQALACRPRSHLLFFAESSLSNPAFVACE